MRQQSGSILSGHTTIRVELPAANEEVLPGIRWGEIEAFPTPAYWVYQTIAKRLIEPITTYRLGETLCEEVVACILGGYGIPARVGVAAFNHLKAHGAFDSVRSTVQIEALLTGPLQIGADSVYYRFARQKAEYVAQSLEILRTEHPPLSSGRALRDWALRLPGVGMKTASWIARNWLSADDVAIIDVHLLRACQLVGVFDPALRVEREYLELERRFLRFSKALNVRPSDLDAVIWRDMANSGATVRRLLARRLRAHTSLSDVGETYAMTTTRTSPRQPVAAVVSLTEQIVEALIACGSREFPSPSRRYRCFSPRPGQDERLYWVGRCGALRAGRTVSDSVSIAHHVPQLLARAALTAASTRTTP